MSTIEDLNRAIQLAIDHVVEEYRQKVDKELEDLFSEDSDIF